jgi:hypothetical protein
MSEHDAGRLWPTYALRAWLGALLAQSRRVSQRLEARIGLHERMITHLRHQIERSHKVIGSLEEALGTVDAVLRRHWDAEIVEAQREGEAPREPPAGPQSEQPPGEAPSERNSRRRER